MSNALGRIRDLADRQHGTVAVWQMHGLGLSEGQIRAACRRLVRVHHGVYATRVLDTFGWFRAAVLAGGPLALLSHESALALRGLRPYRPRLIDVTVPRGGERRREGIEFHRPRRAVIGEEVNGIPVTSVSDALRDAVLAPYARYRALEEAQQEGHAIDLPLDDVVRLKRSVLGYTRSDPEAQVLILCREHGITLPLVNQVLNGFITDFHWPEARVVLEVDGWEFHKTRDQFEEDRRRTLIHSAAGWQVIRASAVHVMRQPELVLAALGVRYSSQAARERPAAALLGA